MGGFNYQATNTEYHMGNYPAFSNKYASQGTENSVADMEIEVPAAPAPAAEQHAPDLVMRKRQRKPDRSTQAVQAAQARADQAHVERMRAAVKKPSVQKAKPAAAAPAPPEARPRRYAPVKHWEEEDIRVSNKQHRTGPSAAPIKTAAAKKAPRMTAALSTSRPTAPQAATSKPVAQHSKATTTSAAHATDMPSALLAATQAVLSSRLGVDKAKTKLATLRQIKSQAAAVLQALSAAPSLQPIAAAVAPSSQRPALAAPAQVTTEPAEPAAKPRAAAKPAAKAAKGAGKKTPGGPCDVCLITESVQWRKGTHGLPVCNRCQMWAERNHGKPVRQKILAEREVNRARNAARAAAVAAQNLIASAEGSAASAALPRAQPQAMSSSSVQNALYEQSSTDSSKLEALVAAASLASSATAQPHSQILTRSRTQAAAKMQSNQPEASTQGATFAAVAALAQEQDSNMTVLLDAIMLESEGSQASEQSSLHLSDTPAAPDASAMLAAGAGAVLGNPLFQTSSTQAAVTSRKRPSEDTEAPVAKRRTRRN